MLDAQVEGEHLTTSLNLEGDHSFEGENNSMTELFEGEHQNDNLAEGEHDDTENINLDQNDEFHVLNDNISVARSENEDMYEDAPLDFDLAYPPLEKWRGII